MKIRSVRLEHFRKFTDPIVLDGFTDGINVLAESNEFGKSTLLAAIRGVLFERHVSKAATVAQMQHWSNKTSPVISLEFELASGLYKIEKRFLHKEPYARLTMPGGVIHHDEAAEEQLQRVLNFTQAGKTGSKADNVGMWAALWVTQRESVEQPGFTESARQTIHGCLDQEVGELTGGSRGKKLLLSVRTELAKIRDGNKKPSGRYKEATAELAVARESLVSLQERQQRLMRDITELQEIKRKLAETNAGGEELRTTQLLGEAHQKREAAQRFEDQERAALAMRQLWSDRVSAAEKEFELRNKHDETLKDVSERINTYTSEEAGTKVALQKAEESLSRQRELLQHATTAFDQAGKDLREARAVADLATMDATLQTFRDRLTLADGAQIRVNALAANLASLSVTEQDIVRLRECDKKLRKTEATLEAQATHLTLKLLPETASLVRVNGKFAPTDPVSLIEDAVINIEGVGEILIQPGVQDRQTLLGRQIEETRQLREALDALSCANLERAEEKYAARVNCDRELSQARQKLLALTPADLARQIAQGIEALRNFVSVMENRVAAEVSAAGLSHLPGISDAQEALREAESSERESSGEVAVARVPLSALESDYTAAVLLQSQAENQKANALKEEQKLIAERGVRFQQESPEALTDRLRTSRESLLFHQSAIQTMELSRPTETVAILETRIERLDKAIKEYAADRQSKQQRQAVLKNQIEREEGVGIEEQVLAAQHVVDQLDREVARHQHETKVFELLLGTLENAEQTAKERYMAPIVKRVTPYLQMLFPGASIDCDEQFQITGIVRDLQQAESFYGLSVGTQEQIAVLTRLAFADMLLDRGQPATIILDDALAYSDPERMERMFDLLTEAAKRTQILILTCRGELFTRLGGNRLRVLAS